MHDLLIENAVVCDGTGNPRFVGGVHVSRGVVTGIHKGASTGEAAVQRIDADGLVLAPGFVDPHTHYDAQVAWDPLVTSSSWHGVTTVVQGNCGVGVAPLPEAMREMAMWDLVHVEDIPYDTLSAGIRWDWQTFGEYLDAIQRRGIGVNVASLVPLTPLRQTAIGEACLDRAANDDELVKLCEVFRQSLRDGGFGWSSTFLDGHVGYGGRPVGCRQADRREIEGLCRVMAEEQLGSAEMVFNLPELGSITDDALETLELVTRTSGRKVTYLALINNPRNPKSYLKAVEKLGPLLASGLVVPQFPVKPITTNFNLKAPNILSFNETLRSTFDQSTDAVKARYLDPDFRRGVQADFDKTEIADAIFDRIRVLDGPDEESKRLMASGESIAEIAKGRGVEPIDCWFDLALQTDLEVEFSFAAVGFEPEGVRNLIQDGRFMPGLSDGGAHVATLNDTGYSSHLLGHWCRDQQAIELEQAVRMLTNVPAEHFGIARRGRIAEGFHADLVLFDAERIRPEPPEYVDDLPGGGRRLVTPATGVYATIVNGQMLYREGVHQTSLPGRMLRSTDR